MNADTLRRDVDAIPYWYHKIELPGGIVTPGFSPLHAPAYKVPETLEGKRVLDVGAWDGYWTFEALKRSAREVVAIDDFSEAQFHAEGRQPWDSFDLCRRALGYSEPACQRREMSVYDVSEEELGRFDVVFFFGTIYHLRHPLLGLDVLSSVCDSEIYIESAILDHASAYRDGGGIGHGYPDGDMVMEFYPSDEYGSNPTNWWNPTLRCLMAMVRAAGFDHVRGWKLSDKPPQLALCRGFVAGRKTRQE